MKKFVILSAVLLFAVFILLPGSGNGKYNVSKPFVADSSLSPFLPSLTLVADGGPMPPPFPPNPSLMNSQTLAADGGPMPPPFPPKPSLSVTSVLL